MGNRRLFLLYPLSLLYGLITGLRNFLYNKGILRSYGFPKPVICIGNITAGGTGKTPHVEYLASILKNNFRIAVLSRGYKRKSDGFVMATSGSTVKDIGDEPMQIYRKFPDVMVAVDKNRINGIKTIININPETDVILLDDGFQHRKIRPGLSIILSDYNRPVLNDHLLPYGNLREYKKNIGRADMVIITRSPAEISITDKKVITSNFIKAGCRKIYFTSIEYKDPKPLFFNTLAKQISLADIVPGNSGVVLITGIATPDSLRKYLCNYFEEIIHLDFPDHHYFNKKDLYKIACALNKLKSPVKFAFTTEKDAVRLLEITNIPESIKRVIYYIPIGIRFNNDTEQEFIDLITDYVREDRGNDKVS